MASNGISFQKLLRQPEMIVWTYMQHVFLAPSNGPQSHINSVSPISKFISSFCLPYHKSALNLITFCRRDARNYCSLNCCKRLYKIKLNACLLSLLNITKTNKQTNRVFVGDSSGVLPPSPCLQQCVCAAQRPHCTAGSSTPGRGF